MKAGDNIPNVDKYRKLVQTFINLHVYSSALFWADKVVALTGNPRDIYWLAQCMYLLKQYHRAIHLLRSQNLEKTHMLCNYLTVKCLLEARDYNEALKVVNSFNLQCIPYRSTTTMASTSTQENILFDDTPRNQTIAAVLLLKGKVLEAMDNRALAADCYKQALDQDVYCYEAFDCLIKYQMLTAAEEEELLHSLPIAEQCSQEEAQVLLTLYESKLKKYHTPTQPKSIEGNILFGSTPCSTRIFEKRSQQTFPSLPATPISTFPSSPVPKTPNTTRNEKDEMPEDKPPVESMVTEEQAADSSVVMTRLKDSLDLHVAEAERLFYNCDYRQCSQLTDAILKQDPYHTSCLPIHISCQVELKRSSKLFSLAHNLVDLYPNMAISWYAVGCYYYIIGKSDCARRYLAKATSLDRLFGPAWLAYGHSFAVENEHDQAMAAYFKATQLMKGCHLPLLYIGLECGLTNNVKLGEKFCSQAQAIAPDDPFIMHEKGVIAFIKQDYESAEINFKQALEKVKEIKKGIIPERWGSLYNNLGHTCRKLKKYEEALEYHKSALLLAPQSPSIYSAIGFVYSLIGNIDEAIDWFHKSLGLKRDDTFSTTMLNYVIERQSEEQPPFPEAGLWMSPIR
ncbi:cell division cycle protein 16 homolog isoform X2 [Aethina tumida]|uniref:cell division cycle protein 16 homolog isoform X2 n=1 Tax=Aethina tumida TaxID=116153 RepID=UPI00096AFF2F|nr:cell division cycle protein 16 homolog isoform X2 [Aethina tumida]